MAEVFGEETRIEMPPFPHPISPSQVFSHRSREWFVDWEWLDGSFSTFVTEATQNELAVDAALISYRTLLRPEPAKVCMEALGGERAAGVPLQPIFHMLAAAGYGKKTALHVADEKANVTVRLNVFACHNTLTGPCFLVIGARKKVGGLSCWGYFSSLAPTARFYAGHRFFYLT